MSNEGNRSETAGTAKDADGAPNEVANLALVQCSIAATKRRRFHWAAWWTTAPTRHPFVKPDAHGGGARSPEAAQADAEKTIGRSVTLIEPHWARAWARVMQGERPWRRDAEKERPPRSPTVDASPWWHVLDLPRGATLVEIRRAYRRLVLVHHPDRGGEVHAFRRIHRAYLSACRGRPPAT